MFWGLLDRQIAEVVDFYLSREQAEAERETIIADEPEWESTLQVVRVDFRGPAVRVELSSCSS